MGTGYQDLAGLGVASIPQAGMNLSACQFKPLTGDINAVHLGACFA
jgi:hypothetical protein